MNQFLRHTAIFLIPILLLVIGFDLYLRNINSLYKEKVKYIEENSSEIEVLVLVNQSIYFDKRITLKYLDRLEKLKYVLISIDIHSLNFSDQGIRNYWSYYANGIKYKDKRYLLANISPFLFGYGPKFSSMFLIKGLIKKWKHRNDKYTINFEIEDGVNPLDTIKKGYLGYDKTDIENWNEENFQNRANHFNNDRSLWGFN
jgi:hypothetical protein